MKARGPVLIVASILAAVLAWSKCRGDSGSTRATPAGGAGDVSQSSIGESPTREARGAEYRRGGRTIAGHVERRGVPVAATVWVLHASQRPRATAGDGSFELVGLPRGIHSIAAFSEDATGRVVEVDVRDGDVRDVVVRLGPCERALVGAVVDATGGPIVGARIEAQGGLVRTGADGRFRVCTENVPVELEVSADGYASERRALQAGDTDASFELQPEVVLDGIVLAPDGSPAPGMTVRAGPRNISGEVAAATLEARTDDDGRFEIRGLTPTEYRVWAGGRGAKIVDAPYVSFVESRSRTVELRLAATLDITGRVVEDGAPVAGTRVHWYGKRSSPAPGTTGADGTFVIEDALAGEGEFAVDGHTISGTAPRSVDAKPVTLAVSRLTRRVEGRVVAGGAPVPDARIIVAGAYANYDVSPRSGTDGRFTVSVPLGHPTVGVSAESDERGLASPEVEVRLDAPTTPPIVLDLTVAGRVAGIVVDEGGAPIAGATVSLRDRAQTGLRPVVVRVPGLATTHEDGTFRVGMLDVGTYDVKVSIGRRALVLAPATGPIAIDRPGASVDGVRLVARARPAMLRGSIVDGTGSPVPDVSIEIDGRIRRRGRADGSFAVEVLAADDGHAIEFRGRPGFETRLAGVRAGGDPLRVVLAAPGRVLLACAPTSIEVEVHRAGASRFRAHCGDVIDPVPVGAVTALSTDQPLRAAIGEVTSGRQTVLRVEPVGTREVTVLARRKDVPVEIACQVDHGAGASTLHTSGPSGKIVLDVPNIVARLSCFALDGSGWKTERELAATTKRVDLRP